MVSWPSDVPRFLADLLGITDRRQAERQWRHNAAAARPGQNWTITVSTTDSRGRRALSWVSGPVESFPGRWGLGEIKMLGEEYLPDEARPLAPWTGFLAGRTRWHLAPGDEHVPPRLPTAGAAELAAVEVGAEVMVEFRARSHPRLRCIESGTTGFNMHHNGRVGRTIGSTWVVLDDVIGLLRTGFDQTSLSLPWDSPVLTADTSQRPVSLTADSGLSADGDR